ncbi:MAG: nucleotidyl transferase AbiEii/AbiGii toxin family protein [Thermaerobacter sp.]|nr:nucleotidyl transferase AbiEii/AbiGii toxin family protein [Thermaerobacter sp.]
MILDVLDRPGRTVLEAIGSCPWAADYYLAGGTGLALHLGHRRSYDLDFYSREPSETLSDPGLVDKVLQVFGADRARITLRQADQVHWSIDGTKVSFIAYPFALRYPLVQCFGATLADAREIALMKAYALGRRATARDYIDLYFLLRSGTATIAEIVAQGTEKFVLNSDPLFSTRLFLSQLVYTADVEGTESATQLVLGEPLPFKAVETYLQGAVREYVRHTLGGFSGQGEGL